MRSQSVRRREKLNYISSEKDLEKMKVSDLKLISQKEGFNRVIFGLKGKLDLDTNSNTKNKKYKDKYRHLREEEDD